LRRATLAAAIVFALLMKWYYAHADAESLRWILAPVAWSVGALYRSPFTFVQGYGYASRELRFAIVPACAGINFLVVAVGTLWCGTAHRVTGAARRCGWLLGGLVAAYLLTLLANTARIAVAVLLQLHPIPLDAAQLHRVTGAVVFLSFLFAFHSLALWLAKRHAAV
jgi:exosortase K